MRKGYRLQATGYRLREKACERLRVAPVPNTQHPTPNTRLSGFTLLEVIVVLALISLVMGLAAVHFAGNATSSLIAKSVREISGTVKYGRVLAAETGEIQSVTFDLDSRSYGIEGRTAKIIPADIAFRVIDQLGIEKGRGVYSVHLLPSGAVQGGTIVLQKGPSRVHIFPDPIVGVMVVKQ